MAIGEIINLKNRAQVLNYHLADVELDGRTLEMGLEVATYRPMVIDWERRRAWVGTWEELLFNIADILDQEEPDHATSQST